MFYLGFGVPDSDNKNLGRIMQVRKVLNNVKKRGFQMIIGLEWYLG